MWRLDSQIISRIFFFFFNENAISLGSYDRKLNLFSPKCEVFTSQKAKL